MVKTKSCVNSTWNTRLMVWNPSEDARWGMVRCAMAVSCLATGLMLTCPARLGCLSPPCPLNNYSFTRIINILLFPREWLWLTLTRSHALLGSSYNIIQYSTFIKSTSHDDINRAHCIVIVCLRLMMSIFRCCWVCFCWGFVCFNHSFFLSSVIV